MFKIICNFSFFNSIQENAHIFFWLLHDSYKNVPILLRKSKLKSNINMTISLTAVSSHIYVDAYFMETGKNRNKKILR